MKTTLACNEFTDLTARTKIDKVARVVKVETMQADRVNKKLILWQSARAHKYNRQAKGSQGDDASASALNRWRKTCTRTQDFLFFPIAYRVREMMIEV